MEDSDSGDSDKSVTMFLNKEQAGGPEEVSEVGDDGITEYDFLQFDGSSSV